MEEKFARDDAEKEPPAASHVQDDTSTTAEEVKGSFNQAWKFAALAAAVSLPLVAVGVKDAQAQGDTISLTDSGNAGDLLDCLDCQIDKTDRDPSDSQDYPGNDNSYDYGQD